MGEFRSGGAGSAIAVLTVAWLVASGAVVAMNMSGAEPRAPVAEGEATPAAEQSAEPMPAPTPAPLPANLVFASAFDGETGMPIGPALNFSADSSVAFAAWVGVPVAVGEVQLNLARLPLNGSEPGVVWEREPQQVDPDRPFVAGELPARAIADEHGTGTYRLEVFRGEERLAVGAFQIEAAAPQQIVIFAEPRTVGLAGGTHTGVRFNEAGEVTAELARTLERGSWAHARARAVFGSQPYLLIDDGIWAGYWLPVSGSVQLSSPQSSS